MEGEMCTSMCQIRPHPKKKKIRITKNTVNYLCDTKALIEVSNRIRPTSDIMIIIIIIIIINIIIISSSSSSTIIITGVSRLGDSPRIRGAGLALGALEPRAARGVRPLD